MIFNISTQNKLQTTKLQNLKNNQKSPKNHKRNTKILTFGIKVQVKNTIYSQNCKLSVVNCHFFLYLCTKNRIKKNKTYE